MYGECGNTYNLTFSHDAEEKYVMIADGNNNKIWIHDRKTGAMKGSVGDNGPMAGQFHIIDAIAMDSHGNLYTGEVVPGSGFRNSSDQWGRQDSAPSPRVIVRSAGNELPSVSGVAAKRFAARRPARTVADPVVA